MKESISIKAAVCREFGKPLVIETLSLAPPTEQQVRVKLSVCAICHSDIIYLDGGWGGTPPIVYGHEAAGIVEEAGAKSAVKPGDRVIVTLLRSCGGCAACERGYPSQCEGDFGDRPHLFDRNGAAVAVGSKTGGFAEQVVVDSSQVAVVPENLPADQASLLACGVITGWGAVVNTAEVPVGATVAVIGCGGVGLNCLQAAAQSGASPLVAIDLAEEKLALAGQFGATHAFFAGDMPQKALELTDGRGFDYVFMAAGSARAVEQAAQLVAKTGALILVGMPRSDDYASLNALTIAHKHQRILGSKMGGARLRVDIPKLIRLYEEGRLELKALLGDHYPLEKINDAIADSRRGGARRNIIVFD